ncbi:hypothetical protein PC117_g18084 [Phytophthora cactorum]|uniref:Uncharacterized protein n=1 Tax=Phytophthora cactorum TaxID=29920 RepID=A0A8T1C3M7_9STRA|nr:hypothetical protein PC117_g18084 [Phytophthora cactorum]
MRGECSSSTVAVVSSAASGKTTTPDDQSPWLFVALYKRRLELVKLSVLIGLHPDLNPSVTPEVLTEMFELWTRCKLARKRQSDALRSIVVSAYVYLYWAVMYQLGGQPAPLIDAEVCFDPAVSHYSSINLSGFLPALIEPKHAIEEGYDLARPAPSRVSDGVPPRVNRSDIHIFTGTGLGELGPDSDGESDGGDSADDGLGSSNTRGASLNACLFGFAVSGVIQPHAQWIT